MTAGNVVPCPDDTVESMVSTPTQPMLEQAIGRLLGRPVDDVTPARVFLGHVGGSYRTESLLALFGDQALARRAVTEPLDLTTPPLADVVQKLGIYEVASAAPTMAVHLADPLRGRRLCAEARSQVQARSAAHPRVQFVIGDGLSTRCRGSSRSSSSGAPRQVGRSASLSPYGTAGSACSATLAN
jgi:ethanolamine ammonia-lyase small subunit